EVGLRSLGEAVGRYQVTRRQVIALVLIDHEETPHGRTGVPIGSDTQRRNRQLTLADGAVRRPEKSGRVAVSELSEVGAVNSIHTLSPRQHSISTLQRQRVAVVSKPESDDRVCGKSWHHRRHGRSRALVHDQRVIDGNLPARGIEHPGLYEGRLRLIGFVAVAPSRIGGYQLVRCRESLRRQGIRGHNQCAVWIGGRTVLRDRDPGRNHKQNGTQISNNDAAVQHGNPPKDGADETPGRQGRQIGEGERTARWRDRSRARKTRCKIGSRGSAITRRSCGDSSRSGSPTTCIAIFPHLSSEKIPQQGSVSTCREHTGAGFGRLGRRGRLPLRGLHEERGLRFNFIVNTNAPLIASAAATTSSPPRNCPVELRTSPMMYGPKNPPRFPTELI